MVCFRSGIPDDATCLTCELVDQPSYVLVEQRKSARLPCACILMCMHDGHWCSFFVSRFAPLDAAGESCPLGCAKPAILRACVAVVTWEARGALQVAWEKLHTGNWKDVPLVGHTTVLPGGSS